MAAESLVPMEDQAVDEIKAPLSIYNPYAGLFPAEDLEIEIEDKPGDFAEAEKLGFFSPLIYILFCMVVLHDITHNL